MLTRPIGATEDHYDDIIYPGAIPFALVHLAALGVLWTGFTRTSLLLCAGLYVARMIAITAGFHRYFSHRSFQTSRAFQFLLALVSQMSLQKGVLWWSAQHRHHHKYSDTPEDVHSPRQHGFVFAHVGWIFSRQRGEADYSLVPDLMRYPELVWLNRHQHLPGIFLGGICFLAGGWPGLFGGFFLSTVLLFHGTFAINSLAHQMGRQRYLTGDDSRNSWWLALITMGEGWHNNHHYHQSATRQGWRWWEIDVTYYVLKTLSWLGIVWDLKSPPPAVIRGERRLPRAAIEKVAQRLAASVPIDRISERIKGSWAQAPSLDDLRAGPLRARTRVSEVVADLYVPQLPSAEYLKSRARQMAIVVPSIDEVVERAGEIIVDAVSARLVDERT